MKKRGRERESVRDRDWLNCLICFNVTFKDQERENRRKVRWKKTKRERESVRDRDDQTVWFVLMWLQSLIQTWIQMEIN